MTEHTVYLVIAISLTACITFLLRLAPFTLFGGRRDMPVAVRRLALRMPPAVIAVLVVYCLKDLPGGGMPAVPALIACGAVVALHLWKHSTLISIAGGTALYMLLIRLPLLSGG